jgi:hypothetical protein
MNAASGGMTEDQIFELIDGTESERRSKAIAIIECAEIIKEYGVFESAINLGITFGPNDLTFTEFLLFKWIKEKRGKQNV